LHSAHDCSEGGLAVCLAECCIAGGIGAEVTLDGVLPAGGSQADADGGLAGDRDAAISALAGGLAGVAALFAETQSRIVISCAAVDIEAVLDVLAAHSAPYSVIGDVGGDRVIMRASYDSNIDTLVDMPLGTLTQAYEQTLERLVAAG
jgi:phosphoribosylformylglycinamidine synthase